MVVRGDLPFSKPGLVRSEDRRDQPSRGPNDVGVAADGVWAADQIQDGIDAVRVIGVHRIDHVNGSARRRLTEAPDSEGTHSTSLTLVPIPKILLSSGAATAQVRNGSPTGRPTV
jgi:hypothetical protein